MPKKKKLVIWGASGHALVVADIVGLQGEYEIFGFIDNVNSDRHGTKFFGAPILGGEEQLDTLLQKGVEHMICGFGNCKARLEITERIQAKGFSLASAIHPGAIVAQSASIGFGTVIAAASVVNPGASIGNSVIINTSSSIDHECIIEDGVHICPGSHLAGKVTVERGAWVGIGATVIDRVRIGAGSVIGAGAVVVNDIPPCVIAYGVPARIVKRAEANE